MRLWRVPLVGLMAAVVLLAGCVDEGADLSTGGQPGTPIRDGFEVVEGSQLVGAAFPTGIGVIYQGEPVVDDGFRAILEVTGEPATVLQGYVDQARDLGLTVGSVGRAGEALEGEDPVSCGHDQPAIVYQCIAFVRTPDEDDPRSLRLELSRHDDGTVASSHLEMRYSTIDLHWRTGRSTRLATAPLPSVPEAIRPVEEADRLFEGWSTIGAVDVAEGGQVLAELPNHSCTFDTPMAVVGISEDPEATLEDQLRQFVEVVGSADVRIQEPLPVEGGRLLVGMAFDGSASSYVANIYDAEDEDWMLVETCTD